LNCAAIPETLLESELFGHEKGAFTGATASRPGKFENAEGGTLFLDEVGDVSPSIQSKLLRAIEQKEVMRVGGSQVVHADVRIIAATNQDLKGRVEAKAFREDLYYRLNVFNIVVPPLRDRREDIPKLCDHFLALIGKENGLPPKRLSPAALKTLLSCRWPGNVRQLRNALETATLVAQGEAIEPGDLPPEVAQAVLPPRPPSRSPFPPPAPRRDGAGRHPRRPRRDRREQDRGGEAPRDRPAHPPPQGQGVRDRIGGRSVPRQPANTALHACRNGTGFSGARSDSIPYLEYSLKIS